MISNPHDALFKAVFGEPEHARGELRTVVPAALAEVIDWSTLTRCPGSFVDNALRGQHTDLLYSVIWSGGGEGLLYFLFEHQSTPDARMSYRLLRYKVRIWESWYAEHPDAKTMPLIVPLVLYHGATKWTAPRTFEELVEVPDAVRAAVAPYMVRFAYLLDDLSEISDDALRARAMSGLAKLTAISLKHARTRDDVLAILGGCVDVMRDVVRAPRGLEALAQVMGYILEVSEQLEPDALRALLERELGTEAKDTIVTAGQRLIQQGIDQGIEQGERRVLLRLLRQRFGDKLTADVEGRVAAASVEQLDTWTGRVLSAATITELLAD